MSDSACLKAIYLDMILASNIQFSSNKTKWSKTFSITKCHQYVLIFLLLCDITDLRFNVNLGPYANLSGYII